MAPPRPRVRFSKHRLRPGLAAVTVCSAGRWPDTHMGLRGPCVRVGEGFGGFLDLHEVLFYFAIPQGAILPPAVFF
jgi:hypothetical protein